MSLLTTKDPGPLASKYLLNSDTSIVLFIGVD
jgi:hypothetical protein